MSYEEKGVWVYLVVVVGAYLAYVGVVLGRLTGASIDTVDYFTPLSWSIGGSIVAAIVVRIVVEMIRPSDSTHADARDRDIDRTGERIGRWPLIVGALGALILAVLRLEYFWIANVIYLGFVASAVLASVVKLTLYRRGF